MIKTSKKQKRTDSVSVAHDFALKAATAALDKKAEDVKIIHLKGLTDITDFFVVCTAGSDPQVKAIADSVDASLTAAGWEPWHTEGYSNLKWVLLDYVDVVVHVFYKDARDFYGLDRLWADAPYERVEDTVSGIKITPSGSQS